MAICPSLVTLTIPPFPPEPPLPPMATENVVPIAGDSPPLPPPPPTLCAKIASALSPPIWITPVCVLVTSSSPTLPPAPPEPPQLNRPDEPPPLPPPPPMLSMNMPLADCPLADSVPLLVAVILPPFRHR